jgi:hypothetical protein
MELTRREFIQTTAAGVVAGTVAATAGAATVAPKNEKQRPALPAATDDFEAAVFTHSRAYAALLFLGQWYALPSQPAILSETEGGAILLATGMGIDSRTYQRLYEEGGTCCRHHFEKPGRTYNLISSQIPIQSLFDLQNGRGVFPKSERLRYLLYDCYRIGYDSAGSGKIVGLNLPHGTAEIEWHVVAEDVAASLLS